MGYVDGSQLGCVLRDVVLVSYLYDHISYSIV